MCGFSPDGRKFRRHGILKAGALDELNLHIVPIILGVGERLLEDVGDPVLEPVKVIASPTVTHVKYRIAH